MLEVSVGRDALVEESTVSKRARWPGVVLATIVGVGALGAVVTRSNDDTVEPAPDETADVEDATPIGEEWEWSGADFDPDAHLIVEPGSWAWVELPVPAGGLEARLVGDTPWVISFDRTTHDPTRPAGLIVSVWVDDEWREVERLSEFGVASSVDDALLVSEPDGLRVSFDLGATWLPIERDHRRGRYVGVIGRAVTGTTRSNGHLAVVVEDTPYFDTRSYLADHHPEIDLSDLQWFQRGPRTIVVTTGGDDPTVEALEIPIDEGLLDDETIDFLDGPFSMPDRRVLEFDRDGVVVGDALIDLGDWSSGITEIDGALVVDGAHTGWRQTPSGWVETDRTFADTAINGLRFDLEGFGRVRHADGPWRRWDELEGARGSFGTAGAVIALPTMMPPPIELVGDSHTLSYQFQQWRLTRNGESSVVSLSHQAPLTRVDDTTWEAADDFGDSFVFTDADWQAAVEAVDGITPGPELLVSTDGRTWLRSELDSAGSHWVRPEVSSGTALLMSQRDWGDLDDLVAGRNRLVVWIADIPS